MLVLTVILLVWTKAFSRIHVNVISCFSWDYFITRFTDRWSDNALDTLQVIEEMGLDQGYDKLIGVGHSFGASSMYDTRVYIFIQLDSVWLFNLGSCWNIIFPIHLMHYVSLNLSWKRFSLLASYKRCLPSLPLERDVMNGLAGKSNIIRCVSFI